MSDIRTCSECNKQFYMDNGHQCNICFNNYFKNIEAINHDVKEDNFKEWDGVL